MTRSRLTLTVEELNEYVRRTLASDPMLRGICLKGEISNFKRHVSGHWYFTLKDAQSAISCAMFRQAAMGVSFQPRDGQQVRLFGSVGLYAKTGQYQFYADGMEQDGMGEMYALFEKRKQMLEREGLFDASLKKPIPFLPKAVGVVTSKTGAVVHDIARVAWRRNPGMPLYLCPVQVQGEGAAPEIAAGIALLDALPQVEVIIVGRGGGSMEDLWAFNEEAVARAIAACATPVISAVGHETDFTIADFVADLRAPTPSAAAEMAVQPRDALCATIRHMSLRLQRAVSLGVSQRQATLAKLTKKLSDASPEKRRQAMAARVVQARRTVEMCGAQLMAEKAHRLESLRLRLTTAGPMATLGRGYAIVTLRGQPVQGVAGLHSGDGLRILMRDGRADATVTGLEKGTEAWREK